MTVFRDAVPFFRTAYAAVMEDTVTFRELAQGWNTGTNTYETTPSVTYTGAALVRPKGEKDAQWGEELAAISTHVILIPHDGGPVGPDDQATIDAIGDSLHTELEGKVLVVRGIRQDTFNARQLIFCELVRGGGAA